MSEEFNLSTRKGVNAVVKLMELNDWSIRGKSFIALVLKMECYNKLHMYAVSDEGDKYALVCISRYDDGRLMYYGENYYVAKSNNLEVALSAINDSIDSNEKFLEMFTKEGQDIVLTAEENEEEKDMSKKEEVTKKIENKAVEEIKNAVDYIRKENISVKGIKITVSVEIDSIECNECN